MANNDNFQNFVNAELPKRLSINQVPVSGNLPAGKILKTTGIGLSVETVSDDPLGQSFIAVYNNTANPISLNKVLEVNGAEYNSSTVAIPSVKPIDSIAPDVPIGVLYCQLEDDLSTIKMLDEDTKYGQLDPGKVGLAVRVGRTQISGLNTSDAAIGSFVYCNDDGSLTLSETELKIGQVLSRSENGTIYVNIGALGISTATANGGLWIYDIEPQDSQYNAVISEYEYTNDINSKKVASQGVANTYDIKVKVFAISGNTHYMPRVTVNNVPVTMTPGTHPFEWVGEVLLTWSQETPYLVAAHEDGAKHTIAMTYENGPVIESVIFNGYPTFSAITANGTETLAQTEVKDNDTIIVSVKLASASTRSAYSLTIGANTSVVAEQDACRLTTFDLSANPLLPGETRNFQMKTANRGNVVQNLPTKAIAKTQNGSYGKSVSSLLGGSTDGVNTLKCNNIRVTIETLEIQYPIINTYTQKAMKYTESTTWQTRFNNIGSNPIIRYDVLNTNHLAFDTGTAFEFESFTGGIYEKDFRCINSNVYNISLHNVAVYVTRRENGAISTKTELLKVADRYAVIRVSEEYERLRADFTTGGKLTYVQITSDQPLFEAPSLLFDNDMTEAPVWNGDWVKNDTDGYVWRRYFNIKTSTSKGTFSWRNLVAFNLARQETNTIYVGGTDNNTYKVGGFVLETLQVPAWTGNVIPLSIGIDVSDTTKLQCSNLSKGDSGSLNFTYQGFSLGIDIYSILDNLLNLDTYANKYTMTDQNGVIVAKPTHWVNLDVRNASSNTTGEMRIEIEEII